MDCAGQIDLYRALDQGALLLAAIDSGFYNLVEPIARNEPRQEEKDRALLCATASLLLPYPQAARPGATRAAGARWRRGVAYGRTNSGAARLD